MCERAGGESCCAGEGMVVLVKVAMIEKKTVE
jgi:hypothetical protein